MLRDSFFLALLIVSISGLGCSSESATDTEVKSTEFKEARDPPDDTAPVEESDVQSEAEPASLQVQGPARDTVDGNWILVICQLQGMESSNFLFEIKRSESTAADSELTYEVALISKRQSVADATLTSAFADARSVQMVFEVKEVDADGPGSNADFEGELRDGIIWGNCIVTNLGPPACLAAYLVPTDDATLEGREQAQRSNGLTAFGERMPESERVSFYRQFCKEHPTSPLSLLVYRSALGLANFEEVSPKEVAEIADAFINTAGLWGNRMRQSARAEVGAILAQTRYQPEIAIRYLDEAESNLKSEILKPFVTAQIEFSRLQARTIQALDGITEDDPAVQEKAASILNEVRKTLPFDHIVTLALADHDAKQGRVDEAIEKYAELAVLPTLEDLLKRSKAPDDQQPMPSTTLTKLWQEKHGSTDGLVEYMHGVYERRIYCFADERVSPREADPANQVVLCEMFTGSTCPPCVAADVAVGALQETYPTSQLITLRYHQHIPSPDPLVNQHSEARFIYYQSQGTPTIYLNGNLVPPEQGLAGQFLPQAGEIYNKLRAPIDEILKKKSPITIEVAANAQDGQLVVGANVSSLEKSKRKLRLRLVLAEESLRYNAVNQIRHHEMIVRWVFGGSSGVAVVDGELEHSESIVLYDMRRQLIAYLEQFEQGRAIEFPVKPMELERLHLVGFVEDSQTKEILQAATIPVSGELDYSAR